jgi:CMP-N-acetylneuraminic acid synthetase
MYAINDVVFIASKDLNIKFRYWFGRNPKLLECDAIESIDVNYPDDLKLAIAANRIEE